MMGAHTDPWAGETPVFGAPWHARVFALALALHERGVFSWGEWATALAAQIGNSAPAADGAGAAVDHEGNGDHAPHHGEPDHDEADHHEPAAPGDEYYRHWLAALETLVEAKRVASHEELTRLEAAWAAAAERTPHGMPIELRTEDF